MSSSNRGNQDLEEQYKFLNKEISRLEEEKIEKEKSGQELADAFDLRIIELTKKIDTLSSSKEGLQIELGKLGEQRSLLKGDIKTLKETKESVNNYVKESNKIIKESKSNLDSREKLIKINEESNNIFLLQLKETDKRLVKNDKETWELGQSIINDSKKLEKDQILLSQGSLELEKRKKKLVDREKIVIMLDKNFNKKKAKQDKKERELKVKEKVLDQRESDASVTKQDIETGLKQIGKANQLVSKIEKECQKKEEDLISRESEYQLKLRELNNRERLLKICEKEISSKT